MEIEVKEFIEGYEAYITSRTRTWQKQLKIILNPKYAKGYLKIKKRFLKKFELKVLPNHFKDLTPQQKQWWKRNILKQAGTGFKHVGGKAIDISVKKLSLDEKRALKTKIESSGLFKVYGEKITKKKALFGVPVKEANVFHIHRVKTK